MCYDGNALFGTRVEPFEELDGTLAAMLVGFTIVRVEDVIVVFYL